MEDKGLFSRYNLRELLDELDVIDCFTEPGKSPIQGEVLKKQEQLYRDFDVTPLLASTGRWKDSDNIVMCYGNTGYIARDKVI